MTRATTPEEVVERVSNWQSGIGPDDLAEALGWTQTELERYHETGDLPNQASRDVDQALSELAETDAGAWEQGVTEQLEGPVPVDGVEFSWEPGTVTQIDREIPAYWEHYTRWRAMPTGDGGWKVLGEQGQVDEQTPMDRRRYDDYGQALTRAEDLNRAEVESLLRRYPHNSGG